MRNNLELVRTLINMYTMAQFAIQIQCCTYMKSVIHVYTSNNSVENVYCAIEYNFIYTLPW